MENSLIYDITFRIPERKIVLKNDHYVLLSSTKSSDIPKYLIDNLVERGFLKINSYGGAIVTNECREFAETLVKPMRKANEHHPGKMIDYVEVPEPFGGA
jgi:hypothetical protein